MGDLVGSWSESCALSGMEISEQDDCYVVLMRPHPYTHHQWVIAVPPIKGRYDDYGSIQVLDPESYRALFKVPEHWTPRDGLQHEEEEEEEKEHAALWIHATAMDTLSDLVRDYSETKNGTVNDDFVSHLRSAEKKVSEAMEKRARMASLEVDPVLAKLLNKVWRDELEQVYREDGVFPDMFNFVDQAIRHGRDLDDLNEAYRRCFVLVVGASELRKALHPSNYRIGPQHGGEKALLQFYEKVLEFTRARIATLREDEDYE